MDDWDFPTAAFIWDSRTGAIMAGGDKLDALPEVDRQRSLTELSDHVRSLITGLDGGWMVTTSCFMVDDIYKSYYRDLAWTPGVEDYLNATARVVIEELSRREMALHYVVDGVNTPAELAAILPSLPTFFLTAGMSVVGPQLAAQQLLGLSQQGTSTDLTATYPYRQQGHAIADEIVMEWHNEHRSTVYLNLDFADDTPGLCLDAAMSPCGQPGMIVVFRNQPPVDGSPLNVVPPPGVALPPGLPLQSWPQGLQPS